jgi:hypothetical protein
MIEEQDRTRDGSGCGQRRRVWNKAAGIGDEPRDLGDASVFLEVRKQKRARAAHLPCIALHDLETGADQWRQIDLGTDGPSQA